MRFHRSAPLVAFYFATLAGVATTSLSAQQAPPAGKQSPVTQDDKPCTISGSVVSANTGDPLRRAHVTLVEHGASNPIPLEILADSSGHFLIEKIPAGRYDLSVERDGYIGTHYGQTKQDQAGAILTLTAGQKMTGLLFRLWKAAAISGRVMDINGDPVQGATVSVISRTMHAGKMEVREAESAQTDDLGEYRVFQIRPGKYILAAEPLGSRGFYRRPPIAEFEQVFYPDTTDLARASMIELKSGDDVSGMDLTLPPKSASRSFQVRGRVQNNTDDKGGYIEVALRSRAAALDDDSDKYAEARRNTGEFEFDDVAPGDYIVSVIVETTAGRTYASQPVTVAASDLENVVLVVGNGITIPARLVPEGKAAATVSHAYLFLVDRDDSESRFGAEYLGVQQRDGSYIWNSVNDGNFRLAVRSDCSECYLKAADANGVDVLTRGVQVSGGAGPGRIDILYSSESATVNGTVTNKDDLPAAGATVVMIPSDAHIKTDDYKHGATDQYGHFELRGLPPGKYTAYAFDAADEDTYGDADAMKHFDGKGVAVEVSANDHKSADLKLIITNDPAN
jgi:hypothetical protein